MKRKEAGWEFLWVAKRKALWFVVFGVMMASPDISGAQQCMMVKMTSAVSTENGTVSINTAYTSEVGKSKEAGVEQTQYLNKVFGMGSPTTAIAEFVTNGNSEIAFAGLTILKDPGKGNATLLDVLEKIGTGYANLDGAFAGAAGSAIMVTETAHSTSASTKGGVVYYFVESAGVGTMKAGVAGEYCTECVKAPPEVVSKGGIDNLRCNLEQAAQSLKPTSQIARTNVEYSGTYSGSFEGIVAPPK